MLEEIDRALHDARQRARRRDELDRSHAEADSRLNAIRAQLVELERRLSPHQEADQRVDTQAVLQMVQQLRARGSELAEHQQSIERQLAESADAGAQYAAALSRKEEALRGSGDPRSAELTDLAQQLSAVESALNGHDAAYLTGAEARRWVHAMRAELSGTRQSTWDVGGDRILANAATQRRRGEGDEAADRAKHELVRFAQRLADIGITADPKLDGAGTSWVGDVVFENFRSDAVKHKQIVLTSTQADDMSRWLTTMVNWLRDRYQRLEKEHAELRARREELLVGEAGETRGQRRTATARKLPDGIDHGVRQARERVHRHDQLSRRHAGLAPRLETVLVRLQELKQQVTELERKLGRPETVSFTGLLASLSASPDGRPTPERAMAEAARLLASGHRNRKQQLLDDLRELQEERDRLGPAREEYETAVDRRKQALAGDRRAAELAELAEALGVAEADLAGYDEARQTAEEVAEALTTLRGHLEQGSAAPGADPVSAASGGPPGFAGHGDIYEADRAIWRAQRALDVLAGALAGIGVGNDPQNPLPETRRFADALFERIITDLIQHRRISTASQQLDELAPWVGQMMTWLTSRHAELEEHCSELHDRGARLA